MNVNIIHCQTCDMITSLIGIIHLIWMWFLLWPNNVSQCFRVIFERQNSPVTCTIMVQTPGAKPVFSIPWCRIVEIMSRKHSNIIPLQKPQVYYGWMVNG